MPGSPGVVVPPPRRPLVADLSDTIDGRRRSREDSPQRAHDGGAFALSASGFSGRLDMNSLFRRKPISETEEDYGLRKCLSAFDLTLLGIGAIIGTGIFVLTGHAAATQSGPAVVLSFVGMVAFMEPKLLQKK